jgi:hypothetical protein
MKENRKSKKEKWLFKRLILINIYILSFYYIVYVNYIIVTLVILPLLIINKKFVYTFKVIQYKIN